MSKQYEIKTIQDLASAARESGDVETLTADIKMWLEMAVELDPLKGMGVTFQTDKFIWNDDGENRLAGIHVKIDKEKL